MKMNFLCEKHRAEMARHPEYAVGIWLKLINAARKKVSNEQWNEAATLYGNAFETLDTTLSHSPSDYEIERYIMTATEFAFALRYCSYPSDLQMLVAITRNRLENNFYPTYIQRLLKPLIDVAFAPINELKRWMMQWLQAKQASHKTQYNQQTNTQLADAVTLH